MANVFIAKPPKCSRKFIKKVHVTSYSIPVSISLVRESTVTSIDISFRELMFHPIVLISKHQGGKVMQTNNTA